MASSRQTPPDRLFDLLYTLQERSHTSSTGEPSEPPPPLPATSTLLALDETYPGLVQIQPSLYLLPDLLSPAECDALIAAATPDLQPSRTEHGRSNTRTSDTTFVATSAPPCAALVARVARLTARDASYYEPVHLARYRPGQFFSAHYDDAGPRLVMRGGARVCTVLAYLNDVPRDAGGGTRFARLGVEVQPRRGTAVIFFPAALDGKADPEALHEALPLLPGRRAEEKWVATLWVHQYPLETGTRRPPKPPPPPPAAERARAAAGRAVGYISGGRGALVAVAVAVAAIITFCVFEVGDFRYAVPICVIAFAPLLVFLICVL